MVNLSRTLQEKGLASRMVMQVHDELLCEVLESEREEVLKITVKTMEEAMPLKIPLRVSTGWGRNWRECS
jgi:DNA polymerase-1